MRQDPPLAYQVHRIALVGLTAVVALLFVVAVVVAAEPFWLSVVKLVGVLQGQWRS